MVAQGPDEWTPSVEDPEVSPEKPAKKVYNRDFLMQYQSRFTAKPASLPEVEVTMGDDKGGKGISHSIRRVVSITSFGPHSDFKNMWEKDPKIGCAFIVTPNLTATLAQF